MEESRLIFPTIFVISEYVIILISKGLVNKTRENRCFGRNILNFCFVPILGVNIFETLKKNLQN